MTRIEAVSPAVTTMPPQRNRHEHYTGILADDLALIFLSTLDLQRGTKHDRDCFLLFGLHIYFGDRGGGMDGKDSEAKTVAMLVPKVQDRNNVPQPDSQELGDGTFVPFLNEIEVPLLHYYLRP
jgi:hypothetical protein